MRSITALLLPNAMRRAYRAGSCALLLFASFFATANAAAEAPAIFMQAHRGGLDEVPENTLPAFEHAWKIPGAIPEMDLQTTQDGVIVLMHDTFASRTSDAAPPWDRKRLREIPWSIVQTWDVGAKFDAAFVGTRVPTLNDVFAAMKGHPERQVYLDLKDVDLDVLKARILAEKLEKQVIFVHGNIAMCAKLKALYPGARTMTWLSGAPQQIKDRFAKLTDQEIAGLSQLQFHLQVKASGPPIEYVLDDDFLRAAVARLQPHGVVLQLRPFQFDHESLHRLAGLGIQWYVADAPAAVFAAWQGNAPATTP